MVYSFVLENFLTRSAASLDVDVKNLPILRQIGKLQQKVGIYILENMETFLMAYCSPASITMTGILQRCPKIVSDFVVQNMQRMSKKGYVVRLSCFLF